jgi:gamma-glutamyltranspeptidase/glutathione hydrolase
VVTALLLPFGAGGGARAAPGPRIFTRAAVASDHDAASAAGAEALRAGGNAADAACATALALGVVNPHLSGIGGGGFALIHVARERRVHALDFRERAPAALTADHFKRGGAVLPALAVRGGLAVGVPGEVQGLAELVRRWGKLPFRRCVDPALRLARDGFRASPHLVQALAKVAREEAPEHAEAFMARVLTADRGWAALRPGDLVRRPELARTLAALRLRGPRTLTEGPIARAIVESIRASGGVLTAADLRAYRVTPRTPLTFVHRGHHIHTMPPPSSGGVVLAEALGILAARAQDPVRVPRGSVDHLHVLVEAAKHGFADRARWLGDPDFVAVPIATLTAPAYHRALAARLDDDRVLPIESYGTPDDGPGTLPDDGGTTHLSVIDADGNAVALTSTTNLAFGAHLAAGETGVLLNNQMDDFSLAPGTANDFGLIGGARNAVAPRKRPLSSMSPTIVLAPARDGGGVKLVLGGAGGPTIISGTLQVLSGVLDFDLDAQAASSAPRVHHQWRPDRLDHEPGIAADVVAGLARRGHPISTRANISRVNVLVRRRARAGEATPPPAFVIEAATEARGGGAPAGL